MLPTVRSKFRCVDKTETTDGYKVKLEPVTYGSKENEESFKYTPYGSLEIGTINREAADTIMVGEEYYIDITRAL